MPLRNHFQPPLFTQRHWTSCHTSWAVQLAGALNKVLPPQFFAEPHVQVSLEIDVAVEGESNGHTEEHCWVPGTPTATLPMTVQTEVVEVRIFSGLEGPVLAGVMELVSPANKDRPETRHALVAKCSSYLQSGVGLILLDIVTTPRANLHQELLVSIGAQQCVQLDDEELFAGSYHPVIADPCTTHATVDYWHHPLRVGMTLPTLPLWLRRGPCLAVPLEESYELTCQGLRIRS